MRDGVDDGLRGVVDDDGGDRLLVFPDLHQLLPVLMRAAPPSLLSLLLFPPPSPTSFAHDILMMFGFIRQ